MLQIETGKAGEIIALLRLTNLGLHAEIVHVGVSDILVLDKTRTWRVQVKASRMKGNKTKSDARNRGYQFCISKGGRHKQPLSYDDCDIVALVAIEQERAIFIPVEHFKGQKTIRKKQTDFNQENLEEATWQACMDWYKNNR